MTRAIHAAEGPCLGLQPIDVGGVDRMNDVTGVTLGFAATQYVTTLSGCC